MPSINFQNVPTMDLIKAGTYEGRFEDYSNEEASTDGSPMIQMVFEITEEGEFKGRKVYRNHSLKEQALWALKRTCIALGADPEKFEGEEDIDTDDLLDELRGADCRLVIKHKRYEGELRADLKSILAPAFEFAS